MNFDITALNHLKSTVFFFLFPEKQLIWTSEVWDKVYSYAFGGLLPELLFIHQNAIFMEYMATAAATLRCKFSLIFYSVVQSTVPVPNIQ